MSPSCLSPRVPMSPRLSSPPHQVLVPVTTSPRPCRVHVPPPHAPTSLSPAPRPQYLSFCHLVPLVGALPCPLRVHVSQTSAFPVSVSTSSRCVPPRHLPVSTSPPSPSPLSHLRDPVPLVWALLCPLYVTPSPCLCPRGHHVPVAIVALCPPCHRGHNGHHIPLATTSPSHRVPVSTLSPWPPHPHVPHVPALPPPTPSVSPPPP